MCLLTASKNVSNANTALDNAIFAYKNNNIACAVAIQKAASAVVKAQKAFSAAYHNSLANAHIACNKG